MSTPTPEILPTMNIWQVFADYGYDGDRLVESFDTPERASAACSRANEHLSQKPPCPSGSEYDDQEWTEHAKADAAWMAAAPYPTYCAESYVARECAVVISRANPLSPAEAERVKESRGELIEGLSALEHEQWMAWASTVAEKEPISDERRARWMSCMVPYSLLSEEMKEHDRAWARKILALLEKAAGGRS